MGGVAILQAHGEVHPYGGPWTAAPRLTVPPRPLSQRAILALGTAAETEAAARGGRLDAALAKLAQALDSSFAPGQGSGGRIAALDTVVSTTQAAALLREGEAAGSGAGHVAGPATPSSDTQALSSALRSLGRLLGADAGGASAVTLSEAAAERVEAVAARLPAGFFEPLLPAPSGTAGETLRAALSEVDTALRAEYTLRRAMVKERAAVTLRSLLWSDRLEVRREWFVGAHGMGRPIAGAAPLISEEMRLTVPFGWACLEDGTCIRVVLRGVSHSTSVLGGASLHAPSPSQEPEVRSCEASIDAALAAMPADPAVALDDVHTARLGDLYSIMDSATSGAGSGAWVKSVRIGAVPDRGGRVEGRARAAPMPGWTARKAGNDRGGASGSVPHISCRMSWRGTCTKMLLWQAAARLRQCGLAPALAAPSAPSADTKASSPWHSQCNPPLHPQVQASTSTGRRDSRRAEAHHEAAGPCFPSLPASGLLVCCGPPGPTW